MAEKTLVQLSEKLENEAIRIEKAENALEKVQAQEEEGYDGFTDTKLTLIPTPNFTDCPSVGTMLPINMASETVTNLSRLAQEFDFVDFVKEKLGYSSRIKVCQCFASEQLDALVLAIKSFEKHNAFILGDMAGIGKGRVCAGVLRYAYIRGLLPVFVTHKPYLFTDIWRDISDIDGFGTDKKGKVIMPSPFIFNGNEPKESSIKDMAGNILVEPLKPKQILAVCKTLKLPKEYNCIFLSYSQMSHTKSTIKQNFLQELAPKTIFVFDESHNSASANSNSRIMKRAVPLVEACNAILFSSATYAKTPDVFGLYVIKTALRTAVPSLESISDALKVGGENVSEYIASGLVKEGQMIRRERSFGDCKKVTDYVGNTRSIGESGETIYTPDSGDTQREFYDEAIGYFKELRDFSKSDLAKSGIYAAISRRCAEIDKEIVPMEFYLDAMMGDDQAKTQFIKEYDGRWVVTYSADSISRYKATFRENLFLAVKAKFTADKIIECLTTQVDYTDIDGTTRLTPLKPLIAVRNTGEAIFNELDLKEGDELNNDFAEYLQAVYRKLFVGTFKLRKIDYNIFERVSQLIDRGVYDLATIENFYFEEAYEVNLSDFPDDGEEITDIQTRLDSYKSDLPLSIIDYLRDKIETIERPDFYYADNTRTTPKYGGASSSYFRLGEATGRKSMLVKTGSKWVYTRNNRVGTTQIFRTFNSGVIDVMLLNVTASTGGSAQSSPKEGSDTRQRNMFIMQFELDINVEVQKRGRVNRTGQLNSPIYTYIISRIPVELRTYLMFRKKLRKLDANTSANQTASSETSEIKDAKGLPIQDIFNVYGFAVFTSDFIDAPKNIEYHIIYDEMGKRSFKSKAKEGEAEEVERNIEEFNSFVRELELYPAEFQESFFNQMNDLYIDKVIQLKALNEYQLELEAQNYKAALKQRVVIQLNSGSTVFSLPLFLSDYFTLESNRAWTKNRVMQKMDELATTKEGKTLPLAEYHVNLIEDYEREFIKSRDELVAKFNEGEPKAADFNSSEEHILALEKFEAKRYMLVRKENQNRANMIDLLRYFKPKTPVAFEGNLGYFVGYRIKDTQAKFKYSNGSIEFVFCFLSRYPTLHLKVSSNLEKLQTIQSTSNLTFSGSFAAEFGRKPLERIEDWKPDYNKRTVRRFLTGNILSAIIEGNNKKKAGEIKGWSLVRYTNIDSSISTAVELKFEKALPDNTKINVDATVLSVAADNPNLLEYIDEIPTTGDEILRNSVIWNSVSDKVIERSVVVFKKEVYNTQFGGYYTQINIQLLQPYKENKETGVNEEVDVTSTRYSEVYHDSDILKNYKKNLINKGAEYKIKYGKIETATTEKGVLTVKTKYNDYKVFIKTFAFNYGLEKQALQNFFGDLYRKYQVSFDFRSSGKDYYNEAEKGDTFDESKPDTGKKEKEFAEGEYVYRFTKRVADSIALSVPNIISRTLDGAYGGVILRYPLSPNLLPSFELKPYRLPNDVLVKLTFSILSDEDKTLFAKKLEEVASEKDAFGVGQFVQQFLSGKSVGSQYFFGDLRMPDYGMIFREYALNNNIMSIVFEEEEEKEVKIKKESKTKVKFEDAENFLIALL